MDKETDSYRWFQELLNEKKLWDDTVIIQTMSNILETYYDNYYLDLGLSQEEKDNLTTNIGTPQHIKFLRERQKKIELENQRVRIKSTGRADWRGNIEHQIISEYLLEKTAGISINNSNVSDISKTFMMLTPMHNSTNELIQNISIEAENTKAIILDQLNGYKKTFVKLLEKSMLSHGINLGLVNDANKIFNHLFKTGTIHFEKDTKEHKAGESIEVRFKNQLYGRYNIAEAKSAGLTEEDLDLTDYILKTIHDRYLQNALHENKKRKNPSKESEVISKVKSELQDGYIPVMSMTRIELLSSGKFGASFKSVVDKMSNAEYMPGDILSDYYGSVHSIFAGQLQIDKQLNEMGLQPNDESKYPVGNLNDFDAFNNVTSNIEYVFNMFVHDSIRTIELEERFLPVWNNTLSFIDILNNADKDTRNIEQILKIYYDRVVNRKNQDKLNDKVAILARSITGLYTFVSLGYKPMIWVKSAYYNMQNSFIESIASAASNINTEEAIKLNFPTSSDLAKAHTLMYTDFEKIYALGKKYSIINATEMDAIESILTTKINRSPLKTQFAQIGNAFTDIASRLLTMTAFMVHDGSYEAHTYDKETDTLKYNYKLDNRYFKNGNWISENAKSIFEFTLNEAIDVGLATDKDNMQVGYTFRDANIRFKYYSDKYIIGSMDEYQKVLLGSSWVGQLFMQFRSYLPDKVANWIQPEYKTMYGAVPTVKQTVDGNYEVIRERITQEGELASIFWKLIPGLIKVVRIKDYTMEQFKKEVLDGSPIVKYNLGRFAAQAMVATAIFAALKLLSTLGLSDKDRQKLQWLTSELFFYDSYTQLENQILPISGLIDSIMGIVLGKHNWTNLMRYTGPVNDAIYLYGIFSSNDDPLRPYRKTKRVKVEDMNEKQLKEHELKLEKRREKERLKQLNN